MATNNLTPEQDLLTRDFFTMLNKTEYLKNHPSQRRQLNAILLGALNYQVLPNGAFVSKDTNVTVVYGSGNYDAYPDEWEADTRRSYEAVHPKDTSKASTSGKSKNTKVRKAVLPKDV